MFPLAVLSLRNIDDLNLNIKDGTKVPIPLAIGQLQNRVNENKTPANWLTCQAYVSKHFCQDRCVVNLRDSVHLSRTMELYNYDCCNGYFPMSRVVLSGSSCLL